MEEEEEKEEMEEEEEKALNSRAPSVNPRHPEGSVEAIRGGKRKRDLPPSTALLSPRNPKYSLMLTKILPSN